MPVRGAAASLPTRADRPVDAARPAAAASPSRGQARHPGGRAAFLVAVLALVLASAVVSSAGAAGKRVVTVYSVATGVQFINTEDDRVRGRVNNPLDSAANKLTPKGSDTGDGPFAGDVVIYALSLYSGSNLKKAVGSAVYTCYFNYDQHALCKAYYKLKGEGTLVASGPIDFKTSTFTIAVTGGTSTYLGVRGEAKAGSAPGKAQKVDFELLG